MEQIRDIIKNLLGLDKMPEGQGLEGFTDEQLAEAEAKGLESFESAKENKNFEAAQLAFETIRAVREETSKRTEAEAELQAKFAELEEELTPATAEQDEEEEEEDGSGEEGGEVEAQVEVKAAEEEPVQVAASAPAPAPTPRVVPRPKGTPIEEQVARILASGDVEGHSAGASMSLEELARAFVRKGEAIVGSKMQGRFPVAKVKGEFPSDRFLSSRDSAETNSAKIDAVVAAAQEQTRETLRRLRTSRDPEEITELTAAGGLCAPLSPRYDIMQIGDTVRPLKGSLVQFGADRGGIRYVAGSSIPLMSDVSGSVNIYTETQDTSGSAYPKGCIRVDCPTWEEVVVQAIVLCMQVGVWQQLTYPEAFAAWWRIGQVLFARTAETEMWDNMVGLSTAVSAGEGLGATSDALTQVDRAATQFRWRYRISPSTPLRLWYPDWLLAIMRTDLARRAPGDGLDVMAVSDADIARFFAARNIALTTVLDAQSPGGASGDTQAAGALNPWPSTVTTILAPEGTFLDVDMGELNFGTEIRDFTLIRQNDIGAFYESFENVAKVGPEALALTLDICPSGTTAGPDSSFDPCTSGS